MYEAGFSPVCPALYLPLFLNDAVPEEHKNGIDMGGSGSNLTVQLIKGNRTRVEQSTVTGIASGYDVSGGGRLRTPTA